MVVLLEYSLQTQTCPLDFLLSAAPAIGCPSPIIINPINVSSNTDFVIPDLTISVTPPVMSKLYA